MKTEICPPAETIDKLREFRTHQQLFLSGHTKDGAAFSGEWTNYYPAVHLNPPGRIELTSQDTGDAIRIWVKDIRDLEHSPIFASRAPVQEQPPTHLGYFCHMPGDLRKN